MGLVGGEGDAKSAIVGVRKPAQGKERFEGEGGRKRGKTTSIENYGVRRAEERA